MTKIKLLLLSIAFLLELSLPATDANAVTTKTRGDVIVNENHSTPTLANNHTFDTNVSSSESLAHLVGSRKRRKRTNAETIDKSQNDRFLTSEITFGSHISPGNATSSRQTTEKGQNKKKKKKKKKRCRYSDNEIDYYNQKNLREKLDEINNGHTRPHSRHPKTRDHFKLFKELNNNKYQQGQNEEHSS